MLTSFNIQPLIAIRTCGKIFYNEESFGDLSQRGFDCLLQATKRSLRETGTLLRSLDAHLETPYTFGHSICYRYTGSLLCPSS